MDRLGANQKGVRNWPKRWSVCGSKKETNSVSVIEVLHGVEEELARLSVTARPDASPQKKPLSKGACFVLQGTKGSEVMNQKLEWCGWRCRSKIFPRGRRSQRRRDINSPVVSTICTEFSDTLFEQW